MEPLEAAHTQVASACSSHGKRQDDLEKRVSKLSTEQQAHQAALGEGELRFCQTSTSGGPEVSAVSQSHEPWRRELGLLRQEQQAALADQVRLLRKQFEAAYRAEQ